jgi:peptide chain release factor subunit 1
LSVQEAIRSLQARLALIKSLPENGLALFSGVCEDAQGKQDHVTYAIEPLKPLQRGFYRCDNRFHTDLLRDQFTDDHARFGFIIMDGSDTSFYVLAGKNRETLFEWSKVNLPKKHGRGGQSQNRFARIREEKREIYVNRVAEIAIEHFMGENCLPNVVGLILAGCADFKSELFTKLDQRLKSVVLTIVDVQYNGVPGFNECVEKCSGVLKDSEFMQERALLAKFFELVKTDQPAVYGIAETMKALLDSGGAVERILVSESLNAVRAIFVPRGSSSSSGAEIIFFGTETEVNLKANKDDLKLVSSSPLVPWILENAKAFGAEVEVLSDWSAMAAQFAEGFGGLGGTLRYQWIPEDTLDLAEDDEEEEVYEW